ncbi:MAG: DUF2231 domain-containing protein [Ilumatobacteraceae bacterium]
MELFRGLPAHPLFVHMPVVIVPLAGIIAIVFAFRPAWLDKFGWGLVGLSGLGAIGGILAASSGEGLEHMLKEGGEEITPALENHAEAGEMARNLAIVFFVIVLAVVVIRHLARKNAANPTGVAKLGASKAGAIAMSALIAVSAGLATWSVADAGHEGAEIVWCEDAPAGCDESGTDEGEEEEEENGAPADAAVVITAAR